jgi:LPS-assembly protein
MMRRRPVACVLAAYLLVGAGLAHRVAAQPPSSVTVTTPGGEVTIVADRMEQPDPNLLVATGNVELTRGTTRLLADRVDVNRDSGDAVAVGRVIFYDGEDRLTAERIDYNLKTGTGVVHDGQARSAPYYRIAGERMERLDESRYLLRQGIFTTCEDDPPTWAFGFRHADADLDGIVYGTNASVLVKGLPILPWFPILGAAVRKERQTGFLFPSYGTSTRKGYFIEAPFFWAIADNQDLTVTFDYYSSRGVGLTTEYRYILSPTANGSIRAFGIHETEVPSNQLNTPGAATTGIVSSGTGLRTATERGWWGIQHNWTIQSGLTFKADINGVSDDLVLREYADSLVDRSRPSVQSNVFATWTRPSTNVIGNLFWYQDLTTLRPVELNRLPDLRFLQARQPIPFLRDVPLLKGLTYDVSSQLTNFVRDVGSQGVRFDLFPNLALPLPVYGVTVTPFVAPRLTAFSKTVTGRTVALDGVVTESTRDEPIARRSLDLGAVVETHASRLYDLGGFANVDALLHSIEPRVSYTWRTGDNLETTQLPQWMSDNTPAASTVAFSVVNRVRARTPAPEGTEPFRWELVRFTMGSSYDFQAPTRPLAPVSAELIVDPVRYFRFRADTSVSMYNGEGLQTANTDFSLVLPQFAASLGTRFARANNSNFLQASTRADLTRYLSASASTAWDVRSNVFVENRVGIDIRFQCWAFDFAYVTRPKEQGLSSSDNQIRFAIYLLGVGGPFGLGQRFSGAGPAAGVPGR